MPWPAYDIAGGLTFLPGAGLLALAGVIGLLTPRRWLSYLSAIAAAGGIALVAVSAEALPIGLYAIWAMAVLAWMFRGMVKRRRVRTAVSVGVLLVTAVIAGIAISYQTCPTLPPANAPRLYVIGDSISAPIGTHDMSTWSGLLASQHGVQVVNLARSGATIAGASQRVQAASLGEGVVLLEIGGNDMLAKADPEKFAADLDALAREVRGGGRTVVMMELPLFPFGNAYGLAQRRIASEYHFILIPRRCFADVLSPPEATIDGIHLTPIGHRRMAELVWKVVSKSFTP
jgi:acyl-CoA thioesterase I